MSDQQRTPATTSAMASATGSAVKTIAQKPPKTSVPRALSRSVHGSAGCRTLQNRSAESSNNSGSSAQWMTGRPDVP